MTTFLKKLFAKEESVDVEKIQDQANFSFERCQLDKHLLSLVLSDPKSMDVYQDYMATVLLYVANEPIALKYEVDQLLKYVDLYSTMHSDSLYSKIETDLVEGESPAIKIYPLLLFPLLRNAVMLGYNTIQKYPLRVRLKLRGTTLKMEVSNRVNHHLQNQEDNADMRWFKARLQLLYPDKYTLLFNSNSNLFKVTLLLQLI